MIACYISVLFLFSKPYALVHPIISLVYRFHCLFFVVIWGPIFSYAMRLSFLIEWQKIPTEILRDKILFWKTRRKGSKKFKICNRLLFQRLFILSSHPLSEFKKIKCLYAALFFGQLLQLHKWELIYLEKYYFLRLKEVRRVIACAKNFSYLSKCSVQLEMFFNSIY